MRKILSLFERDFANNPQFVLPIVTPGCEWVINGEGKATRKYDGSAVMTRNGELFARYDAKGGKTPPEGFEPCQPPDEKTGHWPGWVLVRNQNQYCWQIVAFLRTTLALGGRHYPLPDRTWEACGPHFQSNHEHFDVDILIPHGENVFIDSPPTDFEALKTWFIGKNIEGIVWHHPDGRMAKIKKEDFGMARYV